MTATPVDPNVRHFRTLFISDVHLGSKAAKADFLIDFLRHHEAETIVLVGDIVDGWRLKRNWYWPQAFNDVTQKLLAQAKMSLADIDLIEINEAFAAVVLRYLQAFDLDPARVNVNGGAIAMGHPLGATGAMILGTALDELERRGLATALVTLCIGAGMGTATIIERV